MMNHHAVMHCCYSANRIYLRPNVIEHDPIVHVHSENVHILQVLESDNNSVNIILIIFWVFFCGRYS